MTTNSGETNRIHALAYARKVLFDKFGSNLLHMWPMADETSYIRDLMRKKVLIGEGVAAQAAGMLDYGMDLQQGYISDQGAGRESANVDTDGNSFDDWYAIEIPEGAYKSVTPNFRNPASQITVRAYVAPANLTPSNVPAKAIATTDITTTPPSNPTWNFPFPVYAPSGAYWLYLQLISGSLATFYTASTSYYLFTAWDWNGTAWVAENNPTVDLNGVDAASWASYNALTIGTIVNVDNSSVDGMAVCFADGSEAKAYIKIKSDKKVEGYFKNNNTPTPDSYTVTSPSMLHSGFNLLTLSYEKNVSVKLGVNGVVVATATPSNYAMLNATLALAIGAEKRVNVATIYNQLKNGIIDDVWLAQTVLSDTDLWSIYMAYLRTIPVMYVEDVTRI